MTFIRQSSIEPSIIIEANNEQDASNVDVALSRIKTTESGKSLLKAITQNSSSDKQVTIRNNGFDLNNTIPQLSEKQLKKYQSQINEGHQTNEDFARQLSLKRKYTKGEGTSALVTYNPNVIDLCVKGTDHFVPMNYMDPNTPFRNNDMTLYSFLVHAMRILKGTYTDDLSENGHDDEEIRAIGNRQYADEPISENAFRKEKNYPLRAYYETDNMFNVVGIAQRPGPSLIQNHEDNFRRGL